MTTETAKLRARITALELERDARSAELAYLRSDVARVERAYESASAQAASYRKLRDEAYAEGYVQGRADERVAMDELASKLSPFAPGVV